MASNISFAELTNNSFGDPRRIQASNLALPDSASSSTTDEPGVEVRVDSLNAAEVLMEGKIIRTPIATSRGEIEIDPSPGAGIVLPKGINFYYLDFAPGVDFPLHRTTSLDFITVLKGELSLVTPGSQEYAVQDGRGTYKEKVYTTVKPGEVISQRGIVHGLANRTDSWVRAHAVVIDAGVNRIPANEGFRTLEDIFLT